MPNNKSIINYETFKSTDDFLHRMEALRTSELEYARDLLLVQQETFGREIKRLREKYGPAESAELKHPRIKELETKIAFNQQFLLAQERQLEMVKIEKNSPLDHNTWRIQGMVSHKDGSPGKDLTVALYNAQGEWLRELGSDTTNELGYFRIDVVKKEGGSLEKHEKQGLYVTFTNKSGELFCRWPYPVSIHFGMIDGLQVIKGVTPCQESPRQPAAAEEEADNDTIPVNAAAWVITGNVSNRGNSGISNLKVSLFDQEGQFTRQLGSTVTDESGSFRFEFQPSRFKELFDIKPKIYLQVILAMGRPPFISENAILPEAGKEEVFKIKI